MMERLPDIESATDEEMSIVHPYADLVTYVDQCPQDFIRHQRVILAAIRKARQAEEIPVRMSEEDPERWDGLS